MKVQEIPVADIKVLNRLRKINVGNPIEMLTVCSCKFALDVKDSI